jgi:hypothetical protein
MGFETMKKDLREDAPIRKSIREGFSDIAKQEPKGRLLEKRVSLEGAENGFLMRVHIEAEFGEGDKKNFRFITKNFVYDDLKSALPDLEKEMNFKVGDTITMKELDKKSDVKVRARKRDALTFAVGIGEAGAGTHLHLAVGKIEDKTVGEKTVKVFKGSTQPDSVYWPYGTLQEKSTNKLTEEVESFLKSHKHDFEIELTKEDESAWRVMGQSTEVDGHSHPIDVMDFYSVPTSNAPDTKE